MYIRVLGGRATVSLILANSLAFKIRRLRPWDVGPSLRAVIPLCEPQGNVHLDDWDEGRVDTLRIRAEHER